MQLTEIDSTFNKQSRQVGRAGRRQMLRNMGHVEEVSPLPEDTTRVSSRDTFRRMISNGFVVARIIRAQKFHLWLCKLLGEGLSTLHTVVLVILAWSL